MSLVVIHLSLSPRVCKQTEKNKIKKGIWRGNEHVESWLVLGTRTSAARDQHQSVGTETTGGRFSASPVR